MNNFHRSHTDPSPNIELFAAEIFQAVSLHLENSPEQGQQPALSTRWFNPNHNLLYIPAAASIPGQAAGDRQLTNRQAGIIHLQIHKDSDITAAWQTEWDPPQEDGGRLTWKEMALMLTLGCMAWEVFFP